ncbi:hypothetical protein ACLMOV_11290 [Stenotrophomonas muris]|uniref:hypothetical protein n=1 Tax=Stenotrophomonas muris TaxID=2963283 RepID=UPI0039E6F908
MADFSWLNDVPEDGWQKQEGGFCRSFDYDWFIEKSQAKGNDRWREEFDIWGATQPRGYQQFYAPGTVAFIVWGKWDQRG